MSNTKVDDLSPQGCKLTERLSNLRDIYFRAVPEICTERACLITQFHLNNGLLRKAKARISILDKAKAYRYVLENRTPIVIHNRAYEKEKRALKPFTFEDAPLSLFAGSTTSKFKGVPLFPEFLGLALWPELWKITKRKRNPYHITDSEVEDLNYKVFPHWIENSISEIVRRRYFSGSRKSYGCDEMELLERLVFFITSKAECISHTIPDFSRAINQGLRQIINEAHQKSRDTNEEAKKTFYEAICEVLLGIIAYSRNLAAKAKELADKESDSIRRNELREIAKIHDKVPEFPAETFREGLTTIWICWIAIHLENPNIGLSLGRLDQVLYDLFRKDIEEITIEHAIELVCCLWLKIGDHVPMVPDVAEQLVGGTGSNQAVTIGGVKPNNSEKPEDAVNELTYVMLRATELMKLRDPNLNARYHPDVHSRKKYIKRLCEANVVTGATPALHNDKAVIKALEAKGDCTAHARDYGIIGCVEPGSNGRFYGHSASILMNLTSALELALFRGKHRHTRDQQISPFTKAPEQMTSFDDFKKAFKRQTRWLIKKATTLNNHFGEVHQDFYPTPILSAFFEGPMDKGKDLVEGGAVINSSGATIIGLADVADSLTAIQRVVFGEGAADGEKRISFIDLINALERNFEGGKDDKALQLRLSNQNKTPKYGNEDTMAENNVHEILTLLDKEFGKIENYRGGKYRVGYWTMTSHASFGRMMKALPNGRKAGENLASGITPVSGATPVLTKTLNSVAHLSTKRISSGMALNLKFTPSSGTLDQFVSHVKGYFDGKNGESEGGMEIQFNVISRDDLIDAVSHPENHDKLLVRVSGYTAYFKDLNPRMQKEIIDRTEYLLSTGYMQRYEPFRLRKDEG
jgi:pyruvate formate-lyase/glycerol dehydratase family glycyl radical enzyme